MERGDAEIRTYWSSSESIKVQRYLKNASRYETADPTKVEDARFIDLFVAPRYRGRSVLDFGAGPGRLVSLWTSHGVDLTSTDWSDAFVPELMSRAARTGSTAARLDVARECLDRKFDLVFSTQVLLHVHPRDIHGVLANACKMARRELLFITWQGSGPYDTPQSDKLHSFNHDYRALFAAHCCAVTLEMGITFGAISTRKEVENKVYLLEVQSS